MTDDTTTTAPTPPTDEHPEDRAVRGSTITWGVILVAVAAIVFVTLQVDLTDVDGGVIAAWGILGLGAVLVLGGLVGAIFRRR